MPNPAEPNVAVILERAHRLANDAVRAVALQHRRLHGREPEDDSFVFRWWADLQFLIIALRRLRRVAQVAGEAPHVAGTVATALREFDKAVPDLARMRNVGEHLDSYAWTPTLWMTPSGMTRTLTESKSRWAPGTERSSHGSEAA